MLTCWYYRRLGIPYLDESLQPAVRTAVSRHLSGCADCREHLRLLQRTAGMIRGAAPPPPGLNPQLWRQIEAKLAASPAPARRVSYPVCATGLTAALACLGAFAFLNSNPIGDTVPDYRLAVSGVDSPDRMAAAAVRTQGLPPFSGPRPVTGKVSAGTASAGMASPGPIGRARGSSTEAAALSSLPAIPPDILNGGAAGTRRSPFNDADGARLDAALQPGRTARDHPHLFGAVSSGKGAADGMTRRTSRARAITVAERPSAARADSTLSAPGAHPAAPGRSDELAIAASAVHPVPGADSGGPSIDSDRVMKLASSVIAAGDSLARDGRSPGSDASPNAAVANAAVANAETANAGTATTTPVIAVPETSDAAAREWFYSEVHSLAPDGRAQATSRVWGQVDASGAPVFVQDNYTQGDGE